MKKRPKRENGRGSIFQRQDGRWVAKLSVKAEDGSTKRPQRLAQSREHARVLLEELRQQYPGRRVVGSTTITIAEWLTSWLETVIRPEQAAGTYDSYNRAVRNQITPWLGNVRLRSLQPLQVQDWLVALREAGTGARTRQNAFAVLRAALQEAMTLQIIQLNPCASVRRPKCSRKDIRPFSTDERSRILSATADCRLSAVYRLALTLGMRQGELFGLRWADIDWDAKTLKIEQQAAETAGTVEFKPPKTAAGRRTLPLDTTCLEALRNRQKTALKEGHLAAGLVFTSRNGTVIRRSNFGARHWKPLLKRLEIEHRGFHHTRHTAATMALSAGIPLNTVSGLLGHSSTAITGTTYSHYVQAEGRAAVEQMGSLLRRVGGAVGG